MIIHICKKIGRLFKTRKFVFHDSLNAKKKTQVIYNDMSQEIVPLARYNYRDIFVYFFQISLEYNGRHICGGTLVRNDNNNLVVVTAAHCVDG